MQNPQYLSEVNLSPASCAYISRLASDVMRLRDSFGDRPPIRLDCIHVSDSPYKDIRKWHIDPNSTGDVIATTTGKGSGVVSIRRPHLERRTRHGSRHLSVRQLVGHFYIIEDASRWGVEHQVHAGSKGRVSITLRFKYMSPSAPPPSLPPSPSAPLSPIDAAPATPPSTPVPCWARRCTAQRFERTWTAEVELERPGQTRTSAPCLLSFSPPLSLSSSPSHSPQPNSSSAEVTPTDGDSIVQCPSIVHKGIVSSTCSLPLVPLRMHFACDRKWSVTEITWALNVLRVPFTLLASVLLSDRDPAFQAELMCRRFLACPDAFELFEGAPPLESNRLLSKVIIILSPDAAVTVDPDLSATVHDDSGLRSIAELIYYRVHYSEQGLDYGHIVRQWGHHSCQQSVTCVDPLTGTSSSSALQQEVIAYACSSAAAPSGVTQRKLILIAHGEKGSLSPLQTPVLSLNGSTQLFHGRPPLARPLVRHYSKIAFNRMTKSFVLRPQAPAGMYQQLVCAIDEAMSCHEAIISFDREGDTSGPVTGRERLQYGLGSQQNWGVLWDGEDALIVCWKPDMPPSYLHIACGKSGMSYALFGPCFDHGGGGPRMNVFDCYALQQVLLSERYEVGDDLYFECRWPHRTIAELRNIYQPGTPDRIACVQEAARYEAMNYQRYARITPSLVPPRWASLYPTALVVQPGEVASRFLDQDSVWPLPSFRDHYLALLAADAKYPLVPAAVIKYVFKIIEQWKRTPKEYVAKIPVRQLIRVPRGDRDPSSPWQTPTICEHNEEDPEQRLWRSSRGPVQLRLQGPIRDYYETIKFHYIYEAYIMDFCLYPWSEEEVLYDRFNSHDLFINHGGRVSPGWEEVKLSPLPRLEVYNEVMITEHHWGVLWDGLDSALIVHWCDEMHPSRLHLVCGSGAWMLFGPYPDHGVGGTALNVFDCYAIQQALLRGPHAMDNDRHATGQDLYFECRWPDEIIRRLLEEGGTENEQLAIQYFNMNAQRYNRIVPSLVPAHFARRYPTSLVVQPDLTTRALSASALLDKYGPRTLFNELEEHYKTVVDRVDSETMMPAQVKALVVLLALHRCSCPTGQTTTDSSTPTPPASQMSPELMEALRSAISKLRVEESVQRSVVLPNFASSSSLPPPPPSLPPSAPGSEVDYGDVGVPEEDEGADDDAAVEDEGADDDAALEAEHNGNVAVWDLPVDLFDYNQVHPLRLRARRALVVLAEAAFDENPSLFPHMGGKTKGRTTAFVDSTTGEELARGDLGRASLFIRIHARSEAFVQGTERLRAAVREARACFAALLDAGGDTRLAPSLSSCIFDVACLIVADFISAHAFAIRHTPGIPPNADRALALEMRAALSAAFTPVPATTDPPALPPPPPSLPPSPPSSEVDEGDSNRLQDFDAFYDNHDSVRPQIEPCAKDAQRQAPEIAAQEAPPPSLSSLLAPPPARKAAKVWFASLDEQSRPQLMAFIRSDSAVTRPQFDTWGGKMEPRDEECFATCGLREVTEEATLDSVEHAAMVDILAQVPGGQRVVRLCKSSGECFHLAFWVVVLPPSSLQHLPTPTTEGMREMRPTTLAWYCADVVLSNLALFRFAEPLEAALRNLLHCSGLPVASLNWGPPRTIDSDSRPDSMPHIDLIEPRSGQEVQRRRPRSAPTDLCVIGSGGENGEGGHAIDALRRASPRSDSASPTSRDLTPRFRESTPNPVGSVVRAFCFRWHLGRFQLHVIESECVLRRPLPESALASRVANQLVNERLALQLPPARLLEVWISEDAQLHDQDSHDFAILLTHVEAAQVRAGLWVMVDEGGELILNTEQTLCLTDRASLVALKPHVAIALTTIRACMSQDESASAYSLSDLRMEPCAKDVQETGSVDTRSNSSVTDTAGRRLTSPFITARALAEIRFEAALIIQERARTKTRTEQPGLEPCAKDATMSTATTPVLALSARARWTKVKAKVRFDLERRVRHLAAALLQRGVKFHLRRLRKLRQIPVMVVGIRAQQRRGAAMAIQTAIRAFLQHRRATRDYTATPRSTSARPDHRPSTVPPSEAIGAAGRAPLHSPPTVETVIEAQKIDSGVALIYAFLNDPTAFGQDETISKKDKKKTAERAEKYLLSGGLLYYRDISNAQTVDEFDANGPARIYLPEKFRSKIVGFYHENGGHFGVLKTQDLVTRLYYWPRMRLTIRRYVKRCHVCARVKAPPHGAGQSVRVENGYRPWDVVTIDLYTYQRIDGYDHVLVMADGFTRGVEVVACIGVPTSQQVIDCIKFRIMRGHRTTPLIVRSDHGSIFVSELISRFFEAHHITLRAGSPEHHSTAGLAERFNSVMRDFLITHRLSSGDPRWYVYIIDLELLYNLTTHSVYGQSPTFVEFGHDGRMPWDLIFGDPSALGCDLSTSTVSASISRLHAVWDFRRRQLGLNALAVKRAGDLHKDTTVKFQVHDRVLLRRLPGHPKWVEPYHGPYRIAEVKENDNYRLRDLGSQRLVDFAHVSRLVAYPDITNHGDVTPAPDEYFVHRILARRSDDSGGYQYKVRWRGYGSSEDRWLDLEELANCYEMVQAFNAHMDPLPNPPPAPPMEASLDDQATEALPRSPQTRHFRVRPDGSETAPAPPANLGEGDDANGEEDSQPFTSSPAVAADGTIAQGLYVISEILDVHRPGLPPRLNVLVQAEGVDIATGLPWPPEWLPISRLSSSLKRQARQLELERYDLSEAISSQQEAADHPPLEAWQDPAARVVTRFLRQVAAVLIRASATSIGKLHADGPSAALKASSSFYLRVRRDGRWSWIESRDLSMPERRRSRTFGKLCPGSAALLDSLASEEA